MYICVFDDYKSLDFPPFLARSLEDAKQEMFDQISEEGKFIEARYHGTDLEDRFTLEFLTIDGELYEVDGWKNGV